MRDSAVSALHLRDSFALSSTGGLVAWPRGPRKVGKVALEVDGVDSQLSVEMCSKWQSENWRKSEVKARSGIRPTNGASFDAPGVAGIGRCRLADSMSVFRLESPVKRAMVEEVKVSGSGERLEVKMELRRR